MLEIPNLNKVYEDETGTVFIHDFGGEGKLLVVHAQVIPTTNKKILNHYREVMFTLFEHLRERGIPSVEAWVLTDEQIRFATFVGFELTGEEITIHGQPYHTPIYQMKKDLT